LPLIFPVRWFFARVHKEGSEYFRVSERKILINEARTKTITSRKTPGANCFARNMQQADDNVSFNTQDDKKKDGKRF
jgi:hypothetical protein